VRPISDATTAIPSPDPTGGQRLAAALVAGASWLVCRLPDALLHRLFDLLGAGHYLVNRRRRELARRNLARVCGWLTERGMASPRVALAARDPLALERIVRDVFRHHARYYLEVMRTTTFSDPYLARHLTFERQEHVDGLLAARKEGVAGPLFVGLHFGSMELPARYAVVRAGRPVLTLQETLANPALHAWFSRQRAAVGLEILDPAHALRPLVQRIRAGGIVALVADRDLDGTGRRTELFGAPASLPVGPALVAIEAGVPAWAVAARRIGWTTYAVRVEPVETPPPGHLRERVPAFLAAEARAFERLVADAPEQWWTVLFPIWEEVV
jgi:KDO2-lipid IV(A) lauroyltransferase